MLYSLIVPINHGEFTSHIQPWGARTHPSNTGRNTDAEMMQLFSFATHAGGLQHISQYILKYIKMIGQMEGNPMMM